MRNTNLLKRHKRSLRAFPSLFVGVALRVALPKQRETGPANDITGILRAKPAVPK